MIDTHLHVWDPTGGPFEVDYPWLTPVLGDLYRAYALANIDSSMERVGIDGIVLVQAADSINETTALLSVAKDSVRPTAVVGWLPLAHSKELVRALKAFRANPFLTGVRHLIHDEPDPQWLLRPAVANGMELISAAGLTFDAVAETLDLLTQIPVVADRHQGLTIVIDHLGKPPMGGSDWDRWADLLAAAAARPNVMAKISGLGTINGDHHTAESWVPSINHAIDAFGPGRLMIGSDWPISTQHADYESTVSMLIASLQSVAPAARQKILHTNAALVYRPTTAGRADHTER